MCDFVCRPGTTLQHYPQNGDELLLSTYLPVIDTAQSSSHNYPSKFLGWHHQTLGITFWAWIGLVEKFSYQILVEALFSWMVQA
jgi:hypothetical protein